MRDDHLDCHVIHVEKSTGEVMAVYPIYSDGM